MSVYVLVKYHIMFTDIVYEFTVHVLIVTLYSDMSSKRLCTGFQGQEEK